MPYELVQNDQVGRRTHDEASTDLEALPVALLEADPAPAPRGPPVESFRVLQPPASAWRGQPAGAPPRRRDDPWPDCAVRRVVDLSFAAVAEAVDALATSGGEVVVRSPSGRSLLEARPDAGDTGERRLHGQLHPYPCSIPVGVELVLASWSETRTELRLELRARRRLRYSRRYFAAAHEAVDGLAADLRG